MAMRTIVATQATCMAGLDGESDKQPTGEVIRTVLHVLEFFLQQEPCWGVDETPLLCHYVHSFLFSASPRCRAVPNSHHWRERARVAVCPRSAWSLSPKAIRTSVCHQ